MSTSTATAKVAPDHLSGAAAAAARVRQPARPPARAVRPRLRVVPTPRRSATGLALLCVGLLGAGLLMLLLLNISIGKGAYELTELRDQERELAEQRQALSEQVQELSAPQKLAEAAEKLGMVPVDNPAFIDPENGTVKGEPEAATSPAPVRSSAPTTGEPSR